MPHIRPQPATELEAFCSTCPAALEVTALLARLGFRLAFQKDEQPDRSSQLPPLPAQYHYKDEALGTEVIFLAGRDTPLEGEVFPFHASRFWLYEGADAQAFQDALTTLALAFQITWRDLSQADVPERVEVA
jgi:hypothetical protein